MNNIIVPSSLYLRNLMLFWFFKRDKIQILPLALVTHNPVGDDFESLYDFFCSSYNSPLLSVDRLAGLYHVFCLIWEVCRKISAS